MRASGDRRRRAGRASRATAMPQVARRASRAGTAPAPARPAALGAASWEQHRAGSASAIALIAGRFLLPDLQPLGARPKQQTDKETDITRRITLPPAGCGGRHRRPALAGGCHAGLPHPRAARAAQWQRARTTGSLLTCTRNAPQKHTTYVTEGGSGSRSSWGGLPCSESVWSVTTSAVAWSARAVERAAGRTERFQPSCGRLQRKPERV